MKRILFVDDEPEALASLQRLLHPLRAQWEMEFAHDGAEALACLEKRRFDVLVTDVRMPQMDGVRLLESVRERFPGVTRIALSGYFEREATLQAAGAAHQYLAKPCDLARLREAIERVPGGAPVLPGDVVRRVSAAVGPLPLPAPVCCAPADASERPPARLNEILKPSADFRMAQTANGFSIGLVCEAAGIFGAAGHLAPGLLQHLAVAAEVARLFEPRRPVAGFSLDEWRRHVCAAARVAARLPAPPETAEDGLGAAFLHETGQLVLASRLPRPFERALAASKQQRRPLVDVEQEHIGTTHAEVGAYLLSLWGLPPAVVNAVLWHGRPSGAGQSGAGLDALAVAHVAHALAGGGSDLDSHYLATLGLASQVADWVKLAGGDARPEELP